MPRHTVNRENRPFRKVRDALSATEEGRGVLRALGYQIVIDTKTLSERIQRVRP